MQIKLSKAQWEAAGKKAGWLKTAQTTPPPSQQQPASAPAAAGAAPAAGAAQGAVMPPVRQTAFRHKELPDSYTPPEHHRNIVTPSQYKDGSKIVRTSPPFTGKGGTYIYRIYGDDWVSIHEVINGSTTSKPIEWTKIGGQNGHKLGDIEEYMVEYRDNPNWNMR